MSTGFICKQCGGPSPAGIGYAVTVAYAAPAPAAGCPNPHDVAPR